MSAAIAVESSGNYQYPKDDYPEWEKISFNIYSSEQREPCNDD